MANATHTPEVAETKTVVVAPETVTLELSPDEARYLLTLTGRTNASGFIGPINDSIYGALTEAIPGSDEAGMGASYPFWDTKNKVFRDSISVRSIESIPEWERELLGG